MVDSTPAHFSADIESRARDALAAHLTHATDDTDTHRRYHDRLSRELECIGTAGLAPYISTVTALVDRARELGIVVGPGRGSAPSSLVLFLLGVTQIDPLAHGLIVERWFSNPAIEIDVEWYRRDKLLDDLWAHYGPDCVAYISTYRHDNQSRTIRSRGIHAACVALSPRPIDDVFPVWTAENGRLVIDADRDAVEAAGITVLTILGMKELTSIADIDAPDDDNTTMNYIANGVTDGVFQLSSAGMKRLLRYTQPKNREHLIALVAAYRPPFMNDGTTDELARRMRSSGDTDWDADAFQSTPRFPEDNLTDLPSVADVLAETFGLLLFQEQFIEIVHRITGWSYFVSELYRFRARTKAREQDVQDELIAAALAHTVLSSKLEAHLRQLIVRGRHTVLKSHVVAYTRIGWKMAYRQAHQMDVRRPHLTEQVLRGERVVEPDHPSRREEGI